MKVEFDVEMTTGKLYDYLLQYSFSTKVGILSEVAGMVVLVLFLATGNLLFLCIGLIAMIYLPLTLYMSAGKQLETNPFYQYKIHYIVSEQGLALVTGEHQEIKQYQSWLQIEKIITTSKNMIVYTDPKNACVLPREDMGEQGKDVFELARVGMIAKCNSNEKEFRKHFMGRW